VRLSAPLAGSATFSEDFQVWSFSDGSSRELKFANWPVIFYLHIDICLMDLMDGDCWCSATLQWRMADNFPYESCIGSKIHVKPRG
jgi:hypothetical protein